jgi:hypothetical protein
MVLVVLLAAAGIAHAEWGTISVSETHVYTGAWSVDMTMHITTVGAASPASYDWMGHIGQLYYPYTWNTTHPLFVSTTAQGFEQSGRQTNGGFPFNRNVLYSLTCPNAPGGTSPSPGLWAFWLGVWAADEGATTWTTTVTTGPLPVDFPYSPNQPTPTPPPVTPQNPVPTLSMPGLLVLGLIMAALGVLVLRRTT